MGITQLKSDLEEKSLKFKYSDSQTKGVVVKLNIPDIQHLLCLAIRSACDLPCSFTLFTDHTLHISNKQNSNMCSSARGRYLRLLSRTVLCELVELSDF
jgi:hypothetical protein